MEVRCLLPFFMVSVVFYPNLRMFSIFAFDWPISSIAYCHLAGGSTLPRFTEVSASIIRSPHTFFCIVFPCSKCFLGHFSPSSIFSELCRTFHCGVLFFPEKFSMYPNLPVIAHWVDIQLFCMQLELCSLWIM